MPLKMRAVPGDFRGDKMVAGTWRVYDKFQAASRQNGERRAGWQKPYATLVLPPSCCHYAPSYLNALALDILGIVGDQPLVTKGY